MPQPPCNPGAADLGRQIGMRHQNHRAPCPGRAVPADPAQSRTPERTTTPRPQHEHISALIGDINQHPPGRPALYTRLDHRITQRLSPHRCERIPQPLARQLAPFPDKAGYRLNLRRAVTARRLPCQYRHQYCVMRSGQELRIPQRCQAARRAARTDDDALYPSHRDCPLLRTCARSETESWRTATMRTACRLAIAFSTLPEMKQRPLIFNPGRQNQKFVCRPGFPARLQPG